MKIEEKNNPNIYVIIVAAGSGSRFGSDMPKQFCLMNGQPLLMTTISRFHRHLPNSKIVVVLASEMCHVWHELCEQYGFKVPHSVANGGPTRSHSVLHGIKSLFHEDYTEFGPHDIILIHDGARPNIGGALIHRAVSAISEKGFAAAVPVVNVTDSMRQHISPDETIMVNRKDFCFVQTPQAFNACKIARIYVDYSVPNATDDASLAESFGLRVGTFEGDYRNIKVTNPADLKVAEIFSATIDQE